MKTKEQIIDMLKKEFDYLKKEFGVSRIALFGSYARNEQSENSDIDILVEFKRPIGFFTFIHLEDYLTDKLGSKVDLVTPDALRPLMKPQILSEAIYA
jgi:predicted nucleotidyltransferase